MSCPANAGQLIQTVDKAHVLKFKTWAFIMQ